MTEPTAPPEYAVRNRRFWDAYAPKWVDAGVRNWAAAEPTWGIWDTPEEQLHLLEGATGRDVIELGCGTAYVSGWLARLGARPVGIDNSAVQLETARRLQAEHGVDFPLIHGIAEAVPYPDASFDIAISEYGAAIWADPYLWIPEASRLLRAGGRLVFLTNGYIQILCEPDSDEPATDRLMHPQFDKYRFEWSGDESVEFHLPHGEMIGLLHANGFEVEELIEVRAPEDGATRHAYVTKDWARRWPSEEVWKARKKA